MHLLFCAHFTTFLFHFWGVLNWDIFPSKMLRGGLICVICSSKSFHCFLFKLCIMIVHILKMCTNLFCAHFKTFVHFCGVINLDIFPSKMLIWCLVCILCKSNSFHFLIFKLYTMIVHTLKMFTSYFVQIWKKKVLFLTGVELRHFFPSEIHGGCLVCVICNSNSIHSFFIQTVHNDCSYIEGVHPPFCAPLKNDFLIFEGCWT